MEAFGSTAGVVVMGALRVQAAGSLGAARPGSTLFVVMVRTPGKLDVLSTVTAFGRQLAVRTPGVKGAVLGRVVMIAGAVTGLLGSIHPCSEWPRGDSSSLQLAKYKEYEQMKLLNQKANQKETYKASLRQQNEVQESVDILRIRIRIRMNEEYYTY